MRPSNSICGTKTTWTTLHLATWYQDSSLALQLGYDSDVVNTPIKHMHGAAFDAKNEIGDTVLHVAVDHSWSKVIQSLLEKGASPDVPDILNRTPLYRALYRANESGMEWVVRLLISSYANLDLIDGYGKSSLEWIRLSPILDESLKELIGPRTSPRPEAAKVTRIIYETRVSTRYYKPVTATELGPLPMPR